MSPDQDRVLWRALGLAMMKLLITLPNCIAAVTSEFLNLRALTLRIQCVSKDITAATNSTEILLSPIVPTAPPQLQLPPYMIYTNYTSHFLIFI